jgi:glycosyltransferase involved in cell wall biosynthesis
LSSQQAVAFQWDAVSYSGWGVYGVNLLRHWSLRPDLVIACSRPIMRENLDLDPLELALIDPALRRSRQLCDDLEPHAGSLVHAPFAVLQGLTSDLMPIPAAHGVRLRGTPTIGITFMESALVPLAMREQAKRYPLIVVGSRWNQTVLSAAGIDQTALVLQGVDPTLFHPAPRAGVFGERFVIFSGGKLERRKGQDIVLRAFRLFAGRHPDALLMTAWGSPWPQAAVNINEGADFVPLRLTAEGRADTLGWTVANGIAPQQVMHFGPLPNARLPRILREADVALFPSRAEGGTNLPAMEAMACGVPTILSANTGHLDLIELGGCQPLRRQSPSPGAEALGWCDSDIDEIVAALETVYRDREAAREIMGRQGASRVMALSWARQLDLLAETIRPYLGRS